MLESLPVFDNDFVATMSQFLDAGSIGNGGVTIVVNGMEVSALNVSASAMQQIRINQDPYSAEYSRPGRGRVEILTKPGAQQYHGEGHADLPRRATSTRATRSPRPSRRSSGEIYEGFLGGPIGSERQDVVHAVGQRPDPEPAVVRLRDRPGRHHPGQPAAQAAARRASTAASRGRSATRTPSRSGRTTSTRSTRTAASAARRWPARRARSRTTSSRSPTRSRRSCARRCSTSSRCCSATSASRPSAPPRPAPSSSTARSPAAARRPIWCAPRRTST